jgi:protein TonB
MEIKKRPDLELDNNRLTNWLMGCIWAVAVLFVAFEWNMGGDTKKDNNSHMDDLMYEDDVIPVTQRKHHVASPPPAVTSVQAQELKVVTNDTPVPDETVQAENAGKQPVVVGVGDAAVAQATKTEAGAATDEEQDDDNLFQSAEDMPEFPGGMEALMKWLSDNIKYPQLCMMHQIQGKVVGRFIVNKDGTVSDVTIVTSVDPLLDKEALRVLTKMPHWKAGRIKGKPVRVMFTMPILFKL